MLIWIPELVHRGTPLNKYHSYVLYEIQSSFLFSSGHKFFHQGFLHMEVPDTTGCPLMPLPGKPPHTAYNDRKSYAPPVNQRAIPYP
jgi:hypothetical protein